MWSPTLEIRFLMIKKHCCSKRNMSKSAPWKNSYLCSWLRKGAVRGSSFLCYPTGAHHFPDSLILYLSRWSPWHTAPFTRGKILSMLNTLLLWTSLEEQLPLPEGRNGTNHNLRAADWHRESCLWNFCYFFPSAYFNCSHNLVTDSDKLPEIYRHFPQPGTGSSVLHQQSHHR